jgi:hypothetical protein
VNSGCSPLLNGPRLVKQVPPAGAKKEEPVSVGEMRLTDFSAILLKLRSIVLVFLRAASLARCHAVGENQLTE